MSSLEESTNVLGYENNPAKSSIALVGRAMRSKKPAKNRGPSVLVRSQLSDSVLNTGVFSKEG